VIDNVEKKYADIVALQQEVQMQNKTIEMLAGDRRKLEDRLESTLIQNEKMRAENERLRMLFHRVWRANSLPYAHEAAFEALAEQEKKG